MTRPSCEVKARVRGHLGIHATDDSETAVAKLRRRGSAGAHPRAGAINGFGSAAATPTCAR